MESSKLSNLVKTIKPVIHYMTIIVFGISLVYATHKLLFPSAISQGLDFRYLWIAGKIWWSAKNPYDTSILLGEYEKYFGFQPDGAWFYPPAIAPICMLLSIIPFELSEFCWRIFNYLSLLGIVLISWLYIKDCHLKPHQRRYWQDIHLWIGASYGLVMQSTLIVFHLGQTSIMATLGLVLLLYGCLKNYLILGIVGGYIVSLKPTLGLIPLIAFMLAKKYRIVLGSFALTIITSFLAFFQSGLWENIQGFMANTFLNHSDIEANSPTDLTGIIHLFNLFFDVDISSKILIFFALIWGIICGLMIRYNDEDKEDKLERQGLATESHPIYPNPYGFVQSVIFMNLGTILFMPLHIYDFVVIIPVMIYSLYLRIRHVIWLMPGWIVICRPKNLAQLIGIYNHEATLYAIDGKLASLLASLFTIILVAASVWGLLDSKHNPIIHDK